MNVPAWVWLVTVGGLCAVIMLDFWVVARNPRRPAMRECLAWVYLVFTANAFALMGLRQLFFLIGGLLDRLRYLSTGLAVVLAFIGVKLVVEALHHDGVSWAPQISILVSLGVIVGALTITAVASLVAARRSEREEEAVLSRGG